MSGYCFYSPEAENLVESVGIKEEIDQYAESQKKQTYVLCHPLSKEDGDYDYDKAVVVFASGKRPCIIDTGNDEEALEDFADDFVDDVAYLSEKFRYREKIGRKKRWEHLFHTSSAEDFSFDDLNFESPADTRIADLIASLVIGSINDISRIDLEAEGLLDRIKSKIILFDTDQTSFVFRSGAGKRYVIQGLAGSGKTELLLHKMKEIYSSDHDARIAFTCFNKILASSMKGRIPDFFDFMRVERQIDWDNKLFCFSSWGSGRDPVSGMYRYICHMYGLPFGSLQAGSFDYLCTQAVNRIKELEEPKYIFDYVFVDESQDFEESFLELCELVTEKKVYVAGDVFQNIFRPFQTGANRADMVLKKCYRTDPKNLMFSHALGMGLYEKPVMRWLKPAEWDACGYIYDETNGRAKLSRDPLRRFEDVPPDYRSSVIHNLEQGASISGSIIDVINGIRSAHPTVEQGDIAVLFLDTDNYIYDVITQLKVEVTEQLGWETNVSFESKDRGSGKFFISNINNAKGLEFPFVICFARDLKVQAKFRNALYTMMTRSFLESHLVLGSKAKEDVVASCQAGLEFMIKNNYMDVRVPSSAEIEGQQEYIIVDESNSLEEIVKQFCYARNASPRLLSKLVSRITMIVGDSDYDDEYIQGLLAVEYERHRVV